MFVGWMVWTFVAAVLTWKHASVQIESVNPSTFTEVEHVLFPNGWQASTAKRLFLHTSNLNLDLGGKERRKGERKGEERKDKEMKRGGGGEKKISTCHSSHSHR